MIKLLEISLIYFSIKRLSWDCLYKINAFVPLTKHFIRLNTFSVIILDNVRRRLLYCPILVPLIIFSNNGNLSSSSWLHPCPKAKTNMPCENITITYIPFGFFYIKILNIITRKSCYYEKVSPLNNTTGNKSKILRCNKKWL